MANISEGIQIKLRECAAKYGSLVFAIIPKHEDPVIIFKDSMTPFVLIAPSTYFVGKKNIFDFVVFWQGKFLKNDFPLDFLKHYNEKIGRAKDAHGEFVYPEGMFEIPINAVLQKGIFRIEKNHSQLAKNVLRKYGLVEERRGKLKTIPTERQQLKQMVIKKFQEMKKKDPLPIPALIKFLDNEVAKRYPRKSDTAKADKLKLSASTIRRWLGPFTKK